MQLPLGVARRRPMTGRRKPGGSTLVGAAVTLLAVAVVVLAVLAGSAPPRLTAVAPADGSRLSRAPEAVTFTFSAPLDVRDSHASVVDLATGQRVDDGLRIDGSTLRLPIAAPAGHYRSAYHVTFRNGRELNGQHVFSVTTAAPGESVAAPSPPAETTSGGLHRHGTVDAVSAVLIAVDVALIAVLLLVAAIRRGSRRPAARTGSSR
ncbi:copper resistance protein CopC [Micromonospora sp. NPDC049374]|uniref:copper resistance CopC family protein n=1 Tax=Micromonospora sp. NPDC049374 TaxID=3154352 RepID=UPI00344812F6